MTTTPMVGRLRDDADFRRYQVVIITALNYRQQVIPEFALSRVNTAARMVAWGLGWTVGATLAGALALVWGLRPAMYVMVSVTLLAVVVGWASPLRTADPRAEMAAPWAEPG